MARKKTEYDVFNRSQPVTPSCFLRKLRPSTQIGGEEYKGLRSEDVYKFRELTGLVNYGCEFVDGHCKNHEDPRCCCSSCKYIVGYLDYIESVKVAIELSKEFDNQWGFWDRKTGCKLPRKYRSATCLCHHCNHGKTTEWERALFDILKHGIPAVEAYYAKYVGLMYKGASICCIQEQVYNHLEKKLKEHAP